MRKLIADLLVTLALRVDADRTIELIAGLLGEAMKQQPTEPESTESIVTEPRPMPPGGTTMDYRP